MNTEDYVKRGYMRKKLILEFIQDRSREMAVKTSEILNHLKKDHRLKVTKRTIERDLRQLLENKEIKYYGERPILYYLPHEADESVDHNNKNFIAGVLYGIKLSEKMKESK